MEKLRPFIAEFIGTFALIFIGIGAIHHLGGVPGGLLGIALAHGLTIAVMVSATGHISGGQLNPAVSLGVFVAGKQSAATMLQYWVAQLAGAVAAALLCQMLAGPIGADVVKAGTCSIRVPQDGGRSVLVRIILVDQQIHQRLA